MAQSRPAPIPAPTPPGSPSSCAANWIARPDGPDRPGSGPQDPAFFLFDLLDQGLVRALRRGEGFGQRAGLIHLGQRLGGGADLGLVLELAGLRLAVEHR